MKWLAAVVSVVLLCGSAEAKGKPEAKEAFTQATRFYNLSDFQRALDLFKEAYLDYPDASFLYNIAQCQRQLGQSREAILSFKAYLREQPASPRRDEVMTKIVGLEQQIREDDAAARARTTKRDPVVVTVTEPAPTTQVVIVAPATRSKPIYKKWWLWTAIGCAAVAIGLGVGLGVGLHPSTHYPSGTFTDGAVHF